MLFNVWVLIWPKQKKILGFVPATDEEKAKARKVALLASRTNFALSIPLILCMGSATRTGCRFRQPTGMSFAARWRGPTAAGKRGSSALQRPINRCGRRHAAGHQLATGTEVPR